MHHSPPHSLKKHSSTYLLSILKLLIVVSLVTVGFSAVSQPNKLPPFQMIQANGKLFKAQQLPMGKPILLVYFSPGCDHCEKLVLQMTKHYKELKKLSVALITYRPVKDVASFVEQFALQQHPNFYTGTEGNSFFIKNYYHLEQLPFMVLFTKNGDLVQQYHSENEWNNLLQQIKRMKNE